MIVTTHSSGVERRGYSTREVAAMFGISRRTVYKLINDGELRTFYVGASVRVRSDDLDRLTVNGTGYGNGTTTE